MSITATTAIELPVIQGQPDQTFTVALRGRDFTFRLIWSSVSSAWFCSIKSADRTIEITPFKLVSGKELISHKGFDIGYLMVGDKQNTGEDPSFYEMGTRFTLDYLS